jgi:hypothetical protein
MGLMGDDHLPDQHNTIVRAAGIQPMSKRSFITSAFLVTVLSALASCHRRAPELTPESAKEALLEMMRSKAGKDLGWFKDDIPEKISKMEIVEQEDGWYAWTDAFCFSPSREIYTFTIRPRPGSRGCEFEYTGSFVTQDKRWVAAPPALLRTALQSGE